MSPLGRLASSELFPTTIWQGRATELAARFPEWIALVHDLRAASPEPAGRTNRQGWNSQDMDILARAPFADLQALLTRAVRMALEEVTSAPPNFKLQSWINMHDRGGFNFPHMHEGCLISGCFYLRVPEGAGGLMFRDPRPGATNSRIKGRGANAHRDIHLAPSDGLFVLFPSWLEHYVEPHRGDEARIAIAFNAIDA